MRHKLHALFWIWVVVIGIGGGQQIIGQERKAIVVTDDTGYRLVLKGLPRRIISISPNMTEIIYTLGAEDRLVGVSDLCDYPPAVKGKPRVGDIQIRSEMILALKPDLVLAHGSMQRAQIKELRRLGINVAAYSPEEWKDVLRVIRIVGRLVGNPSEAKSVVNGMEEHRIKVKRRVKDLPPVKVFVEVWNKPLMTAGPGTFLDQLVTIAGGKNIVGKEHPSWSAFPQELVLERDPEVIILTCKNRREVLNRRGWEQITAIRQGRVYEIDPDILSRPGPRLAIALEVLANRIHPVK